MKKKKKYISVVFLQDHEPEECWELLHHDGEEALLDYLKEWDYGDGGESYDSPPWGSHDDIYQKGLYVLSYNLGMGYVSLTRIEYEES
jgi:hypothetical protein